MALVDSTRAGDDLEDIELLGVVELDGSDDAWLVEFHRQHTPRLGDSRRFETD